MQKSLHMFGDIRKIEFLNQNFQPCDDGEMGLIALTDLENTYFPIIRYLNGDLGRAVNGTCDCGVTLPLMDKVKGRVSELIRLPDGQFVSGEYMTTIFDDAPDAVKQFQVHQKSDYSIELTVIPNVSGNQLDSILNKIIFRLQEDLKKQVPISVRCVNSIAQKGGKLRFIRSDINPGQCEYSLFTMHMVNRVAKSIWSIKLSGYCVQTSTKLNFLLKTVLKLTREYQISASPLLMAFSL